MPVMRASSDCRWLSALVTFCARLGVVPEVGRAGLLAEVGDLGGELRRRPTTARMSAKVLRSAAISADRSRSSMAGPAYRGRR